MIEFKQKIGLMSATIAFSLWILFIFTIDRKGSGFKEYSFSRSHSSPSSPSVYWNSTHSSKLLLVGDHGLNSRIRDDFKKILEKVMIVDTTRMIGVLLGDNFYPDGLTRKTAKSRLKEDFTDLFPKEIYPFQWFSVLGNHDYHGDINSQIKFTQSGPDKRWKMKARYYYDEIVFDSKPIAKLIFLDTNTLHQSDSDRIQLAWFNKTMKKSLNNYVWIFVFGHHPIYSSGPHSSSFVMQKNILPILKRFKVAAYICGHNHNMAMLEMDGLRFITSGAASKNSKKIRRSMNEVIKDERYFYQDGAAYATLEVTQTHTIIRFIETDGRVAFIDEIHKAPAIAST